MHWLPIFLTEGNKGHDLNNVKPWLSILKTCFQYKHFFIYQQCYRQHKRLRKKNKEYVMQIEKSKHQKPAFIFVTAIQNIKTLVINSHILLPQYVIVDVLAWSLMMTLLIKKYLLNGTVKYCISDKSPTLCPFSPWSSTPLTLQYLLNFPAKRCSAP